MKHPYGLLLSVRTESEFKRKLKELARKENITLSQLVLKALREFVDRQP